MKIWLGLCYSAKKPFIKAIMQIWPRLNPFFWQFMYPIKYTIIEVLWRHFCMSFVMLYIVWCPPSRCLLNLFVSSSCIFIFCFGIIKDLLGLEKLNTIEGFKYRTLILYWFCRIGKDCGQNGNRLSKNYEKFQNLH